MTNYTLSKKSTRIVQIIFGIIAVICSGIVLIFPDIGIYAVIFVIALAFMFMGVERLIIGLFLPLKKQIKNLNVGFGIASIVISVICLLFPNIAIEILVVLVSFVLMFVGITRILNAVKNNEMKKGMRVIGITVGLIGIALAIGSMIYESFGIILINFFIAIGLLVIGIELIIVGVTAGHYIDKKNLEDLR